MTDRNGVWVYANWRRYACACAPEWMSDLVVASQVNAQNPTGTPLDWKALEELGRCPLTDGKRHWLLKC